MLFSYLLYEGFIVDLLDDEGVVVLEEDLFNVDYVLFLLAGEEHFFVEFEMLVEGVGFD